MAKTLRRAGRLSSSPGRLAVWVIGTLAVGFAASAHAQEMDAVEIRSVELATGLHMLTGRGGNMLVSIGSDGVLLIDDQFAPLSPKILAKIEELGGGPVRMVFNTHWHGDHTGGNENLAAQGAIVIAHENVRVRMSTDQVIAGLGREVPAAPPAAWPVATFQRRINLHLNGQTIQALHVDPAHTDGDAIVHFEEADVIHTGDTYVAGMYPFVDLSSGGRVEGFLKAADQILARAGKKTKIVPGHGPLSDRKQLEEWRAMLVDVRRNVVASVEAGLSVDEILAARPTAEWDERYGGGFTTPERFVRILDQDARLGR
ncbi:MAG: MBL fold metallo-hydrolase [Deltaproteobacteria bacterium]|nr:MBL fold metallo-hydrolase [Deltaproteobacteria bacterium]